MPTTAPARRKKAKGKATQVQVKHRWSYLVFWYEEIRRHTPRSFGLELIQFTAIAAYRDLFEIDMEPWEVDLLMKLDLVWMDSVPKEAPKPKPKK